ncbi:MAG TPA: pitrilysin family protein [Longimicrobiaceae bacterium]|nr:pitrilysin family protein [Longimicrobiaceae bacterium]
MSNVVDRTSVPEGLPLRPYSFPAIERAELSNGLPILVARTSHFPVVTLSAILPAGGVQEQGDRAGLATLTNSLLESGAAGRSALDIAESLEGLGVRMKASTSWDVSLVGYTSLASRADAASEILGSMVRSPDFPPAEVERIRQEQLADIVQRRAEPRGLANEMVARFIYSEDTPYRRPLGGTAATVEGLTRSDAAAFHSECYSPRGAAVVVAGHIDVQSAIELAEARFGDWVGPVVQRPRIAVRPLRESTRVVIVDRPGAVQSEIRIGHIGLARDTPDYFPVIVMNTILGGAFSSRLNLNLRERHGYTYGVSSSFSMRKDTGLFLVSTAVQTEVTSAAVREILNEVEGIRDSKVSDRELDDARNYLAGTFPLRLQTTDGIASRLAELLIYELPDDYFSDYRDRIVEVGRAEVLDAARAHIRPEHFAVVVVGDASAIREPLESLDIGPVEVVDALTLP